ncbi:bifunctional YncE family protein/alkaline phosphatase family protein [bacterium]|nr:bifunctional YncE family protein/alkaline phosphatase family protein [bacterium]
MSRMKLAVLLFSALIALTGCNGESGDLADETGAGGERDAEAPERAPGKSTPHADADLPVGAEIDGRIIIPNGRFISPLGNQVTAPRVMTSAVTSPDGEYVFMTSIADRRVSVFRTSTMTFTQNVTLRGVFQGLAMNAAGDKLWVSGGGDNSVWEFDVTNGVLTQNRVLQLYGYPIGIALSPDESTLYVALSLGNKVAAMRLSDGATTRVWPTGVYPYAVALNDSGTRAYVSNWGSDSITVVNTTNNQVIDEIAVAKAPQGVVYRAGKLYVASSDEDIVSVIDTNANLVTKEISLNGDDYYQYMPTSMMLDGTNLYVVCSGYNAIAVIDTLTDEFLALWPTGWYPSAIAVSDQENLVIVANGKGEGSGPGGEAKNQPGTFSVFDRPDPEDWDELTQDVIDNNERTKNFYTNLAFESPIPRQRGVASDQIKRVIFVMKENKTYDQVFGDLSHTNADPGLCIYCGEFTPNAHALAAEFSNFDNFYSEAQNSYRGHMWATSTICPDYIEKVDFAEGRFGIPNIEHTSRPAKGTIFEHLLDNGIPFRVYGEIVGTLGDMDKIYPYVNLHYGFYNMLVSDETKIEEVIREMEAGIWPPFIFILIPNDHTYGSDEGKPTPGFLVADNDRALGRLVDYVSHSPYWNETAIFVTQDDPQSGADHVDAHRTIGLVISPWAKRDFVSSTLYSMNSMFLTMELILGIPSVTGYDRDNAPMYDAFTMTPDFTPFDARPRTIPLEYNPANGPLADWSRKQVWDIPDQVPNMGEIHWKIMRPGEEFPWHLSVDRNILEEEIAEDADEADEYRAMMQRWMEVARARGIQPLAPNLMRVEPVEP